MRRGSVTVLVTADQIAAFNVLNGKNRGESQRERERERNVLDFDV